MLHGSTLFTCVFDTQYDHEKMATIGNWRYVDFILVTK